MKIVDIETAFLYGELEEEIFMKIPEGLDLVIDDDLDYDDCLLLEKSMHGLVQAARQFLRKLIDVMVNKMDFDKCLTDECPL